MKKTNQGFSLVELIIVIAIMAILAGALAPALIKYINKSRLSSDVSNGQQIASAIQEALTNEDVYDNISTFTTQGEVTTMDSALLAEVKKILGDDFSKAKAKKDADGGALDQTYQIDLDIKNNVVKVYGTSIDPDHMLYPTPGSKFVVK